MVLWSEPRILKTGVLSVAAYVERLQQAGIQISMATRGRSTDYAYVVRMIHTPKEEEVALYEYRNLAEARERIGRFLDDVSIAQACPLGAGLSAAGRVRGTLACAEDLTDTGDTAMRMWNGGGW